VQDSEQRIRGEDGFGGIDDDTFTNGVKSEKNIEAEFD